MKKIKICEINKIEGHISFQAALEKGDVKSAKITVEEGARMIEGILIGRDYSQAPIIASRICGICPVVHNLTSIKAIENALNIKVSDLTLSFRKIMLSAQIIQSHALHLYFCSLPDFFELSDNFKLLKKFPKEGKKAIIIRDYVNKVIEVIGGRTIHPINSVIGGFNVMPEKKKLLALQKQSGEIIQLGVELAEFFEKLKYPLFSRETCYISLSNKKEYAFYKGQLSNSSSPAKGRSGGVFNENNFLKLITEVEYPGNVEKRTTIGNNSYMVGALARIYNNHKNLSAKARKVFLRNKKELLAYNTFYNILAQAIELIHFTEIIEKELKQCLKIKHSKIMPLNKVKSKAGKGAAICEAPRGILYHYYEVDNKGKIKNCNIIAPTAQSLNNIEDDLMVLLKDDKNQNVRKIKFLIRAYDPCISCATH